MKKEKFGKILDMLIIINRRDKADDLPDAKVVKENPPVQDELYINHRTKK